MEKWEYMTKFTYASISKHGAKEFIANNWPDWEPAQYAPQTMVPELNQWGADGWELVHMQPIAAVGTNEDVLFNGEYSRWSSAYFCVFKRRVVG